MSPNELPRWAAGVGNDATPAAPPAPAEQTRTAEPLQPQQQARQPVTPAPSGPSGTALSITDSTARVEGRFELNGTIEVGCELTGEISCQRLIVAPNGNINAVVRAHDVIVRGAFAGEVIATGSLEIVSGGYFTGTAQTDQLIIARGAVFGGDVSRLEPAQQQVEPEPAALSGRAPELSRDEEPAPLQAIDLGQPPENDGPRVVSVEL